jgi:hypothetical protein
MGSRRGARLTPLRLRGARIPSIPPDVTESHRTATRFERPAAHDGPTEMSREQAITNHRAGATSSGRVVYPALIVATQLLDALALVLAWGHGAEANPLMADAIMVVGLGWTLALKLAVGTAVAAVVWLLDLRHRGAIAVICLIGCAGALSALVAAL